MVKFGKDLESNMLQKWAAHYIDYEALKSILKKGATVEVKREFHEAYEAQLKKVSAFFVAQLSGLESAAASRKDTLTKMTSLDQVQASSKHYQVFRDLTDLRSFAWINAEGFRKISKKYDKLMGLRGTDATEADALEALMSREPFMGPQIQNVLDGLKSDASWSGAKSEGGMELKIISGSANKALAEEISGRVGVPLTPLEEYHFDLNGYASPPRPPRHRRHQHSPLGEGPPPPAAGARSGGARRPGGLARD